MHTWILIMTLIANDGYNYHTSNGVSVHSVGGFTTRDGCLAAATLWLKNTRQSKDNIVASAVCVPNK